MFQVSAQLLSSGPPGHRLGARDLKCLSGTSDRESRRTQRTEGTRPETWLHAHSSARQVLCRSNASWDLERRLGICPGRQVWPTWSSDQPVGLKGAKHPVFLWPKIESSSQSRWPPDGTQCILRDRHCIVSAKPGIGFRGGLKAGPMRS